MIFIDIPGISDILGMHFDGKVERLVHVLFHGLASHEAPDVNLCTFLANPPNTSQSLALVGHCRAQGIGIHRMDEDHVIGSRQVGTRSRVLQGQQQNNGLLIINVGHEVAGVQKKKQVVPYTPHRKTLLLGKVPREGVLLSLKQ